MGRVDPLTAYPFIIADLEELSRGYSMDGPNDLFELATQGPISQWVTLIPLGHFTMGCIVNHLYSVTGVFSGKGS